MKISAILLPALLLLAGCAMAPATSAPPPPAVARATVLRAVQVLRPYEDPQHTYTMGLPQTWVAVDARSNSRFARALGDGVRFFEPITAADPDAGTLGKLWIDVFPVRPGSTPRSVLLAPFIADDYPASLLAHLALQPFQLGGVPGWRLVTLASRTQVTLLLARRHDRYYELTVFGDHITPEVGRALRTWRFIGAVR